MRWKVLDAVDGELESFVRFWIRAGVLGVAAAGILVVAGLSAMASQTMLDDLNGLQSTFVSISSVDNRGVSPAVELTPEMSAVGGEIPGVEASAWVRLEDDGKIWPGPVGMGDARLIQRYVVEPSALEVFGVDVVEGRGFSALDARLGTALLGAGAAESLGLSLPPPFVVATDSGRVQVVGIVGESERGIALENALVVVSAEPVVPTAIVFKVKPGWAKYVADVAVPTLSPSYPLSLGASSFTGLEPLRDSLTNSVLRSRTIVIAGLLGLVALTGAALQFQASQRQTAEIGLRRAMGAQASDVAVHVGVRALMQGVAGAGVGAMVGMVSLHLIALFAESVVIVSWTWLLQAIGATLAATAVAGLVAVIHAVRIEPVEAVRTAIGVE